MTTIERLCAAIDLGDDSVLPILADALEEAGDRRGGTPQWREGGAIGWLARSRYQPQHSGGRYGWVEVPEEFRACGADGTLYPVLFGRLSGGVLEIDEGLGVRHYATRSAAYLALAHALAE